MFQKYKLNSVLQNLNLLTKCKSFSLQLRRLTCLSHNFQIAELYLQDNQLTAITGTLHHLTCLQVLMLHNNQLTKLDKVVKEFKKMQVLKTLSKFVSVKYELHVNGETIKHTKDKKIQRQYKDFSDSVSCCERLQYACIIQRCTCLFLEVNFPVLFFLILVKLLKRLI